MKKYIKFHAIVCELVKIENTNPIVITESMDSKVGEELMIECEIDSNSIKWEYATEKEFLEYRQSKTDLLGKTFLDEYPADRAFSISQLGHNKKLYDK